MHIFIKYKLAYYIIYIIYIPNKILKYKFRIYNKILLLYRKCIL